MTCERIAGRTNDGGHFVAIMCSRGSRRKPPAPCRWCACTHSKLCDGKRADGKRGTCNAPMCVHHAVSVGADRDLCPDCFLKPEND